MPYKTYINVMHEVNMAVKHIKERNHKNDNDEDGIKKIEKTLREQFNESKYWNKKSCVQCSDFCFAEVIKSKNNRFLKLIFKYDKKNLPYNSQDIDVYNHKCQYWNNNIIKRDKNE